MGFQPNPCQGVHGGDSLEIESMLKQALKILAFLPKCTGWWLWATRASTGSGGPAFSSTCPSAIGVHAVALCGMQRPGPVLLLREVEVAQPAAAATAGLSCARGLFVIFHLVEQPGFPRNRHSRWHLDAVEASLC